MRILRIPILLERLPALFSATIKIGPRLLSRRLEKDATITRLPMPYTAAKVRVHLHEVIRANKVTEGCARVYLVYNTVGFWQSDEKHPQVDLIIYTAGLPEHREVVRLGLREQGRHAAAPLAGVKSISWLNNVWAVA